MVKCHFDEKHTGDENPQLRDMIVNNCYITNLQKKLDYIETVCKQCILTNSKNNKKQVNKQRLRDIDSDIEEGPGKDYYFEIVNLKKYFRKEGLN